MVEFLIYYNFWESEKVCYAFLTLIMQIDYNNYYYCVWDKRKDIFRLCQKSFASVCMSPGSTTSLSSSTRFSNSGEIPVVWYQEIHHSLSAETIKLENHWEIVCASLQKLAWQDHHISEQVLIGSGKESKLFQELHSPSVFHHDNS